MTGQSVSPLRAAIPTTLGETHWYVETKISGARVWENPNRRGKQTGALARV
jgi:hypothetical protein